MEEWMNNAFIQTAADYSVAVLLMIIFLAAFETLTPYKNWEEIKNGNVSVALATSGKILGVSNIFRFSITHQDTILFTALWGAFGFALLMLGYLIFEFLTPMFNVDKEIAKDNRAVGLVSFILSIGLSFVIGASILASE